MQFCLGCRIGEVRGLCWDSVDFDRRQISIHRELVDDEDGTPILKDHTKSGLQAGNRVLPMSDRAERVLRTIPRLADDKSLIFLRDFKPIRTQTVNDHLRSACRTLGIRYLSTHKIRAWAITEALAAGMDQITVMHMAGHANSQTMQHYIRGSRIKKDLEANYKAVFD